jgi:murein DD-endopeptidase MepM/ murein hydrolase activator NlpD
MVRSDASCRPWSAAERFDKPVTGSVVRPFGLPEGTYGAGHRGIDITTPAGTTVRASAGGVVAFAGIVAGDRYVSIDHPDGTRTERVDPC